MAGRRIEALRAEGFRLVEPARVALDQAGCQAQHRPARQPQAGDVQRLRGPAREQRRRRREQPQRLLDAQAQPGQPRQVRRPGLTTAEHRVHLVGRAPLGVGVGGHAPAPPGQRGGAGLMAGQEGRHAFVAQGGVVEWRAVLVAQRHQHRQQVVRRRRALAGVLAPHREVTADQPVQRSQRAALAPLPGRPQRRADRHVHLSHRDLAELMHGPGRLGHRRIAVAGGEQRPQDHVHREQRHERLEVERHGPVLARAAVRADGRVGQAFQRAPRGLDHQRHEAGHPLRREARLQQLALALPRGTLGHQHALAMGIGEHRGRALPADQPVVARDQQLAHVVGMEEAEIVQAEQPLVDHVAITPLQVAEMAQVVTAQREDLGQPAPAGGRTRNGNGDRQDMVHGRASWRRHGASS